MILKALGLVSLVTVGGLASMDYAVVDVKEGGPEGTRIVVPVPVLLAQTALSFAPDHLARVPVDPEAERWMPVARAVAAELRNIPDAELVRVQDHGSDVRIAKAGDRLEIRVHDNGDDVAVNLPLAAADEVFAAFQGGRLDTRRVVAALHRANGPLVEVASANGDHVSVRIF
jgi:hypothetical protein